MNTNTTSRTNWLRIVLAVCVVVALCAALAYTANADEAAEDEAAATEEVAATEEEAAEEATEADEEETTLLEAPAEINEMYVEYYCGACHFKDIENAAISSFNCETVDAAMVESMVPNASDELIEMLAEYFANIPADDEE